MSQADISQKEILIHVIEQKGECILFGHCSRCPIHGYCNQHFLNYNDLYETAVNHFIADYGKEELLEVLI